MNYAKIYIGRGIDDIECLTDWTRWIDGSILIRSREPIPSGAQLVGANGNCEVVEIRPFTSEADSNTFYALISGDAVQSAYELGR